MRAEGFLVDDNSNPAPENIPAADFVAVKDNRLPLDQEWGRDNTCNQQKDGNHHKDAKVNNHTKQDLINFGFLKVFWLMFPEIYFYLVIVNYTSHPLLAEGYQKTMVEELTCFLRCIFLWRVQGAVKLQFYSCYSSYFIANKFGFHPLTTICSHGD